MIDKLRVIVEIGAKGRRVVAAATDWSGIDRWGTTEDDALEKLSSYLPRYTSVAERAGLADAFRRQGTIEVIERYPGSSSTDLWGIAYVPSETEREVLSEADLGRRLDLLRACWRYFDDVAGRVSEELRPGTRSAGRSREQIIRHTYGTEPDQFSRKVGVRTPLDGVLTPDGLATHRGAYLDAIRAYNAKGKLARTWPIQFLVRRTAHHVMDHAWELQDRDLNGSGRGCPSMHGSRTVLVSVVEQTGECYASRGSGQSPPPVSPVECCWVVHAWLSNVGRVRGPARDLATALTCSSPPRRSSNGRRSPMRTSRPAVRAPRSATASAA